MLTNVLSNVNLPNVMPNVNLSNVLPTMSSPNVLQNVNLSNVASNVQLPNVLPKGVLHPNTQCQNMVQNPQVTLQNSQFVTTSMGKVILTPNVANQQYVLPNQVTNAPQQLFYFGKLIWFLT